jgi:hypothetical protein
MDNEFIFSICILLIFAGFWTIFSNISLSVAKFKTPVDRSACTCDCFDGIFKSEHNHLGYKSIYFNIDEYTGFLIFFSLSMILFQAYILKRVIQNVLSRKQNTAIALCLLLSIYPLFYGYWCIWNYFNDRLMGSILENQIFFFLSEVIISLMNLQSLTNDSIVKPQLIWCSISINLAHIARSSYDNLSPVLGVRLMYYSDVISVVLLGYFLYSKCLNKEYYPYTSTLLNGYLDFASNKKLSGLSTPPVFYNFPRLRIHALYSILGALLGLFIMSRFV